LRTLAVFLILSGGAVAQSDPAPQFEVASIKRAAADQRGMSILNAPSFDSVSRGPELAVLLRHH
jgi:hypothetical protein